MHRTKTLKQTLPRNLERPVKVTVSGPSRPNTSYDINNHPPVFQSPHKSFVQPKLSVTLTYTVCWFAMPGFRWCEEQLTLEWLYEDGSFHGHRLDDMVIQQDLNVIQGAQNGNSSVPGND